MRYLRFILLFSLATALLILSCKEAAPKGERVNLLTEGIPLNILAPTDVVVTSSDLGILKDVTIKNKGDYSIQIFESEASSLDVSPIIDKMKGDIESSQFFSNLVSEKEDGFIFEKKIDEDYVTYDFRRVKVIGAKQYVIQAGMSSQHTLESIEEMYNSVQ